MKKLLLLLLTLLLLPMAVSAQDVEIDGIYYRIDRDDSGNRQAIVISHPNKYSGDIDIPGKVFAFEEDCPVVGISVDAFSWCSSLTSITIPGSVTFIENFAFWDCSSLTSVTIGSSVTSIGTFAFYHCISLTSITIPSSVTFMDGGVFSGCSSLTSVTIGSSVTSIENSTFEGCCSLTSVTIPSSVTSIGSAAFEGCSSLTSVTIGSSVTSIRYDAFKGCSSLTSISIPSSVTSIENNVFEGCCSLTSIVVEEGNTQYDSRDNCNAIINTTNNMLIAGCKNTVIPSSVTSIGDRAFKGCSSLTSITIPSSVTSIGYEAFQICSSLTSITIGSSVTSIGEYAFYGCSSLTSVTIPSSVTSIGDWAFWGCSSLTSVTIGSSVTSIGDYAFASCDSLTSVTIGSSVTSIGDNAFANCGALTDVYCLAENVPSTDSYAFTGSSYETATLHVPAGSVEKYKAAEPWKDFGKIEGLKCAKPTIASANGKLTFSCETEGVEFVASVSPSGKTTYKGSSLLLADMKTTYRVSVYARKEGYEDSEAATIDIDYLPNLDDVNGDGQISISDVVGIVDIILKGN